MWEGFFCTKTARASASTISGWARDRVSAFDRDAPGAAIIAIGPGRVGVRSQGGAGACFPAVTGCYQERPTAALQDGQSVRTIGAHAWIQFNACSHQTGSDDEAAMATHSVPGEWPQPSVRRFPAIRPAHDARPDTPARVCVPDRGE